MVLKLGSTSQNIPQDAFRFSRRDARQGLGISDHQVREQLGKLVELEYAIAHRGKNGQRFVYELLYDGQGNYGQPFLMGLVDAEQLIDPVK